MARLNLNYEPVPDVAPTGAPGGDYFRIQAEPAAFGAPLARGLETLGQGVEHAADTGLSVLQQRMEMQDKTHAAELHSWASDQWSQNSGNFLKLEGRAAVQALPAYKQRNQEILDNISDQAGNPYTKLLVQTESRRIMDSHNEMAERHAASQEKVWQHNVASLSEATSGNNAVLFATNGDIPSAKKSLFNAQQEARNQAELQGFTGEPAEQLARAKRGQYVYQIVEGITRKEGPGYGPVAAKQFYDSERGNIDAASATKIEAFLHSDLTKVAAEKTAQDLWQTTGRTLAGRKAEARDSAAGAWKAAGMSDAGVAGVLFNINEESGFDPTLRHPDQPRFAPTDERHYAHGLYQEGAEEWQRYDTWLKATHPGADWRDSKLQSEFAAWNLKTNYPDTWARMNAAATPAQAAAIYAREYLRPAAENLQARLTKIGQAGAVAPATPAIAGAPAALPAAIPASWEQKKAFATAQVLSDPYYQERPQLQQAILTQINRMADVEHAATVDLTAAQKAQTEAAKKASDARELEVMADVYGQNPKISATQVVADGQRGLLTREAVERLLRYYPKTEDMAHDTQTYGPNFYEAFKAIHAPQGDPGRITDPTKLYDMLGHGLTFAGVEKLAQEIYKPKTPEGSAEAEMKKIFLDTARRQVSGEGLVPGMKDPKGEEIFLRFLGYFLPAYDKARAEGKTPGELLNPESKDYLGKSLETMKRPMSEWYSDTLRDNSQVGRPTAATPAPRPTFNPADIKSADQLKAAVKAGTIDYTQGVQIGLQHGWIRENPLGPPLNHDAHAKWRDEPPQIPMSR